MRLETKLKYPLFIFLLIGLYLPTLAQEPPADDPTKIYICVKPTTSNEPYLIVFRQTDIFGLIIPEDATLTLYSATENVVAGVYTIRTDAQTGGYQRLKKESTAFTRTQLAADRPCGNATEITEALFSTIALPVTSNHVLVAQINDDDGNDDDDLDNELFKGVVSLDFRPSDSNFHRDFQIVQLSDSRIEMSFPFLTDDRPTRIVAIANKELSIKKSFHADSPFISRSSSNARVDFIDELTSESLDLFEIMSEGKIRFYPSQGLVYYYPTNGYLRLEIPPVTAMRSPQFAPDQVVTPIEGATPGYDKSDGTRGELNQGDKAQVVNVDVNGQLIVTSSKVGQETIVDAWLVAVSNTP